MLIILLVWVLGYIIWKKDGLWKDFLLFLLFFVWYIKEKKGLMYCY